MLWVLALIAALLGLLCLTRLGVRVELGEIVMVDLLLGFFKIRLAPSTKIEEKDVPKPKKEPKDFTKTIKKIPKPTREDLESAFRLVLPAAKRALSRTQQGVRISPLRLSVAIPGEDDPAKASWIYGEALAAMWIVMPALEQLLNIPDPALHIGVDYNTQRIVVRGQVALSVRIGTLLAIGFGMMLPTIRWLLQFRKAHKRLPEKTTPQSAAV